MKKTKKKPKMRTNNVLNASKDLTGCLTAKEVLVKAGLNWTAKKEAVYLKNGIEVEGNFAVTRDDNGRIIGNSVGGVYGVFQNWELAQVMETLVSEKLATFKSGWAWDGGSKVGIVAEIPTHLFVLGKDELAVQIVGWNSFDGSSPVGYSVEVLRLVCANGMKRFVPKGMIKAKHCAVTADRLLMARETLGLAVKSMGDILEQAEKLARVKANTAMVESFLTSMNLNKEKEESTQRENQRYALLNLFDRGIGLQDPAFKHTLWALYNASTELIDHRNGNTAEEKKAVSAVYGSGARFKESALDAVLALAK